MKASLWIILNALALLAVGCSSPNTQSPDLATSGGDLAGTIRDLTAPGACLTVATWPTTLVIADGGPTLHGGFETDIFAFRSLTNGLYDTLGVNIVVPAGQAAPIYPQTVQLTSADTFGGSLHTVEIYTGTTHSNPFGNALYFAQSGSLTITRADATPGAGSIAVSGTNIHLLEWDYDPNGTTDHATANGTCYDVGSFTLSGSYSNADGGTDM